MKRLGIASFTGRGALLAERLAEAFAAEYEISRYEPGTGALKDWCKALFADRAEGILFVGACGIAVRTIAPFVKSKTEDPAVVVLDEAGKFSISLLSGHLGGANRLACQAAELVGAQPVITTATDVNGKFAVDVFAKDNHLAIGSMQAAKAVSAAILRRERVGLYCEGRICGAVPPELEILKAPGETDDALQREFFAWEAPDCSRAAQKAALAKQHCCGKAGKPDAGILRSELPGVLIVIAPRIPSWLGGAYRPETFLWLRPKALTLGVGCRRGKSADELADFAGAVFARFGLSTECIAGAASIDLKKKEAGLLEFCARLGLPLTTWSADELMAVQGDFTPSEFVRKTTGADNVCERAALRLAGPGGKLLVKKQAENGVTLAVAQKDWEVHFQ